jgi:hypothetical protein
VQRVATKSASKQASKQAGCTAWSSAVLRAYGREPIAAHGTTQPPLPAASPSFLLFQHESQRSCGAWPAVIRHKAVLPRVRQCSPRLRFHRSGTPSIRAVGKCFTYTPAPSSLGPPAPFSALVMRQPHLSAQRICSPSQPSPRPPNTIHERH